MAEEVKKKGKKGIIISIIIILLACIIGGTIAFVTTSESDDEKKTKSVKTEWGNSYYLYLADNIDEDLDGEYEISFIETKNEEPIMLVEAKESSNTLTVCYIEDNKVKSTSSISSSDSNAYEGVEYLYNIEDESYDWYIHTENSRTDNYISTSDYISNKDAIEVSSEKEFDEKFIKIEDVELSKTEIKPDASKKDIKKAVETETKNYKTKSDLVTEEIEKTVKEIIDNQTSSSSSSSSTGKLSNDEALKIGQELYDYGTSPETYDIETHKSYIGKSKKETNFDESITIKDVFLAYPFGESSDVEDYFTEKRLSEMTSDKDPNPYGIEKVDGKWYYLQAPVGGDPTYAGTLLKVKEITENKITYTATSYYSVAWLEAGDTDITYDMEKEELINAVKSKYACETIENDFIIVKEDGKWKIDVQEVMY